MGYTHYWTLRPGFDHGAFEQAIDDMKKLACHSEVPVARGDGRPGTDPVLLPDRVELNGLCRGCVCPQDREKHLWPNCYEKNNQSNETFFISAKEPGWSFCKTERKPYDTIIVASLLALKHHLPEHFFISSDGSWEEDWLVGSSDIAPSGVRLYEYIFQERAPVQNCFGTPDDIQDEGFRLHDERLRRIIAEQQTANQLDRT